MFNVKNITAAKFMNPRNLCVGDYPLNIEICLTLLGINDRQLLYLLFSSIAYLISLMVSFDALTVTRGICSLDPSFLVGGTK
jgi:hypothetical protein